MERPYLSIIIPVYNEERRLHVTLNEIENFRKAYSHMDYEIVFVDDGSTDNTKKLLEEYAEKFKDIRVLGYQKNQGKGYAVRKGMLESMGMYRLMIDADMSTSLIEVEQCLPGMKECVPILVGTRKTKGAVLVKKQPWYRQGMGDLYGLLARTITGVRIKDFGCGFKAFSKEAAENIFSKTIVNRWVFDTEVLYVAKRMGIPFREIGVHWKNDEDTRVNIAKDAFQSVYDLVRMSIYHKRKKYE